MNFFKLLGLILTVVLTYLQNKRDEKKMRATMLQRVDAAFQKFSEGVVTGNEDQVSQSIAALLNEYDLRKKP